MNRHPKPFANEKQFQQAVNDLCDVFGLLYYHVYDSRRSTSGFPDLVIVGTEVIYAELKTERGVISPAQAHWLATLRAAGQRAYVWRPEDWTSRKIEAELRSIRSASARPSPAPSVRQRSPRRPVRRRGPASPAPG